jgi:hypothetical protein
MCFFLRKLFSELYLRREFCYFGAEAGGRRGPGIDRLVGGSVRCLLSQRLIASRPQD